jgi:hypothetical protein
MEKASRKQTIFSSNPRGVTAWIFLGKKLLSRLKTVSMYWRIGLLKELFPRRHRRPLLGVLLALSL